MKTSALRDARIGRIIRARGGTRPLHQAEVGCGTQFDNVLRIAEWRNRASRVPLEEQLKPIGYVPIARWKSLVVLP